jgi:hypothetical protein
LLRLIFGISEFRRRRVAGFEQSEPGIN